MRGAALAAVLMAVTGDMPFPQQRQRPEPRREDPEALAKAQAKRDRRAAKALQNQRKTK